jgi:hypothetical protein
LKNNLGAIATDLDLAKGFVTDEVARRRRSALESLKNAKTTWIVVTDLAARFQEKGLIFEKNMMQLSVEPDSSPWVEILSANYGGVDVTKYAKVLMNYGDSICIRTVKPGFHETWKGRPKTISVLHQVANSQRIFVCREFTGTQNVHILSPKKIITEQIVHDAELHEIQPLAMPPNSQVQILAILWGPHEVRSQQVYDYCYSKLNNGEVEWNNMTMGGETWYRINKSGVIYYRAIGSNIIRQCTGREFCSTPFKC